MTSGTLPAIMTSRTLLGIVQGNRLHVHGCFGAMGPEVLSPPPVDDLSTVVTVMIFIVHVVTLVSITKKLFRHELIFLKKKRNELMNLTFVSHHGHERILHQPAC